MINPTGPSEAPIARADLRRSLDERSMRILELGLAGIALVAAVLLAGIR